MLYINHSIKIKKNRKSYKISKDELKNKLMDEAKKYDENIEDYIQATNILLKSKFIIKDMKILANSENFTIKKDLIFGKTIKGDPLLGFHTLPNGFTFLGIQLGGDWEYPIFTILYDDGKKIRCYTPSCGNCVNLDFKCAFGSEGEYENVDVNKILEKYREKSIKFYNDTNFSTLYCRKFGLWDGLKDENFGFNWDAIKEDILSRIEII